MIVIERAFESSNTILIDQKKFSPVRAHPEELRAVKSKKCCYIHIISSKIDAETFLEENIFYLVDKMFCSQ